MTMAATMHGGEYAGWIYKQGSLVRNWKKRFMVLRGKSLAYYDTDRLGPRVKEKGSFQVITVELSSDIQNGLLVHGRGGRVLKLYTDSADATNGWYHAIMDATGAGGGSDRFADRFSSLSGNNESLDLDDHLDILGRLESLPLDDSQVQHSGWLKKEGMRVRNWKRRWFTLRGDTLSYFESADTGSNAKGYGHVRAVEVNGEKENSLDIRFDNGRILRVAAKSPESMQEWLCKLSDAIEAARYESENARQSLAVRQNIRASMSAGPTHRASISSSGPLRHSVAGYEHHPQQSQQSPQQLVRPSIANMKMPRATPDVVYERRRSSNGSYNHPAGSYSAQSSTLSSNQSGDYFDDDDDGSDSDGDWI